MSANSEKIHPQVKKIYPIYRKNSKIWDTSNNCHNCPKNRKVWCNIALLHPRDADGMANSVDPDQTASSEAVWSWSALFSETYLSQYIEFVRYNTMTLKKEQVIDNKHVSDLSQSHILQAGIKTYNFDFRVDGWLVIYVHFNSISIRTVGRWYWKAVCIRTPFTVEKILPPAGRWNPV